MRAAAYPWSSTTGFGTKYSDPSPPATFTDTLFDVKFSPDGNQIAFAIRENPRLAAYPWSSSTGFGTRYTNPATLPQSITRGVAFSADGLAVAFAHQNTPYVTAYPWSASGYGTKYANPATLPPQSGRSVDFSADGTAIAVGYSYDSGIFKCISAYAWNSSSGFGTAFTAPSFTASTFVEVDFSPN
jgi:hypothetical protein